MNATRRRVAVVGAGYVGLVTAVGLADLGHRVDVIESEARRIAALRGGKVPIWEPGLQEAFDRVRADDRLTVAETLAGDHDVILICVGTPIDASGSSDLSQLRSALRDVAPAASSGTPLVIRSTLPPGAGRLVVEWSGASSARVVSNPEFLRQGSALHDFNNPNRIVIGTFGNVEPDVLALVLGLFDGLPGPRLVIGAAAAELVKNGSNAFLALKLSFVNELASLCEEYGADVEDVLSGMALDPRIGHQYMQPALGFGGSCLPKELKVLEAAGRARGLAMHVTSAASSANAASQARFVDRIHDALGGLQGRQIGLLGLAFKANTDDVRDSPALGVARHLLDSGVELAAFDPRASASALRALPDIRITDSAEAALAGADAAVIATEWPEFITLPWPTLRGHMRGNVIVDGRRLLDPVAMRVAGFRYVSVGSPVTAPGAADETEESVGALRPTA